MDVDGMEATVMDNSQQSTTHSQTQNNEMVFVSMSPDDFLHPWKQDYLKTREHSPDPETQPEPVDNFPDARRPPYIVEGLGMGPVVFIKRRTAAAASASGASSELKRGSDLKHDDSDIGLHRSNESGLTLGKLSGRHALKIKLLELGYEYDGKVLDDLFWRFKSIAETKKVITDDDLIALVSN